MNRFLGTLAPHCRAKALKSGLWVGRDGTMSHLATMPGPHLVNALLAALLAGEGPGIVQPLAQAVQDRDLVEAAEAEVARRVSKLKLPSHNCETPR